jgi:hypothetical protein
LVAQQIENGAGERRERERDMMVKKLKNNNNNFFKKISDVLLFTMCEQ